MIPTEFRQNFPAFADPAQYADGPIDFYITVANNFLNGSVNGFVGNRWGTQLDYGIGLFVAHHLALDARDVATSKAGGIPGAVEGPASSKTVDRVSKSMDTRAVTFDGEAFFNLTRYGVQFLTWARMFGAGGVQLGVGCDANQIGYYYNNWGVFYGG